MDNNDKNDRIKKFREDMALANEGAGYQEGPSFADRLAQSKQIMNQPNDPNKSAALQALSKLAQGGMNLLPQDSMTLPGGQRFDPTGAIGEVKSVGWKRIPSKQYGDIIKDINPAIKDLGYGKTTVIDNTTKPNFGKIINKLQETKTEVPAFINVKPGEFISAVDEAAKVNPKIKDFVTQYKPEELKDMQLVLTPDKQSGFLIKPDGEISSVFSAKKGMGDTLMNEAINRGGNKLDAFEGYLTNDLYPRHGFEEVNRIPNWSPGSPDVVYMKRPK